MSKHACAHNYTQYTTIHVLFCCFCIQSLANFEGEVASKLVNHPYIAIIVEGGALVMQLVVERIPLAPCDSLIDALLGATTIFFIFDIQYPKHIEATMIFFQQLVLDVKDKQSIPSVVTRVYSALEAIDSKA